MSITLAEQQEQYRSLREGWLKTLSGDHPNAIWRQISHLVREEVWFKTIIRLREEGMHPPVNPFIWDMFTTGYGVKQSLAIRRLTDRDNRAASLVRLVQEIRENRALLTRAVMVGFDGTPMDVGPLQEEHFRSIQFDQQGGSKGDPLTLERWLHAEDAHIAFDRLRAAPLNAPRKSTDKVDGAVLHRLEGALRTAEIKRVLERCNYFLAHADSRDFVATLTGPTYNDIHRCVESIVLVRQFLRSAFLNHSSGPIVATHQGNHLRDLAEPLVPKLSEQTYRRAWQASEKEVEDLVEIARVRQFAMHA